MALKPLGTCPHCNEQVRAKVVEENSVRRDKCQCPTCSAFVLVCRSPGCHDYAKTGDYYDDELCPQCTSSIRNGMGTVALAVVAGIAATAADAATKKSDRK